VHTPCTRAGAACLLCCAQQPRTLTHLCRRRPSKGVSLRGRGRKCSPPVPVPRMSRLSTAAGPGPGCGSRRTRPGAGRAACCQSPRGASLPGRGRSCSAVHGTSRSRARTQQVHCHVDGVNPRHGAIYAPPCAVLSVSAGRTRPPAACAQRGDDARALARLRDVRDVLGAGVRKEPEFSVQLHERGPGSACAVYSLLPPPLPLRTCTRCGTSHAAACRVSALGVASQVFRAEGAGGRRIARGSLGQTPVTGRGRGGEVVRASTPPPSPLPAVRSADLGRSAHGSVKAADPKSVGVSVAPHVRSWHALA